MRAIHEILADLLDYPVADWRSLCDECKELLNAGSELFVSQLVLFASETERLSLSDLQELYTRTFDLSPVCALEIGYHLFGENYKRGVFLARLRETEAPFDLGQEHQLPDYLPVLLRLLTNLDDEDLKSALIVDCMIPALEKMLKPLSEGENPYRYLIEAVRVTLQKEITVELGEPTASASAKRASLPVLTIDPRNFVMRAEIPGGWEVQGAEKDAAT